LSRYDGVRYSNRVDADDINELYELSRADGFGLEVKRRIIIGTYVLSSDAIEAYYIKAQRVRRLILNDFKSAFDKVDTILIPSAPSEAFFTDVKQDNPVEMYLNDIFTIPVSLAGLPSMSVPVSLSKNNLPLGMQVISRHFDEMTMVRVGSAIERNIDIKFIPEGY
jgi:aspartyl-tRNA(Asn)/glutamyl-tRNA(Gln) amidotransferase subunit A